MSDERHHFHFLLSEPFLLLTARREKFDSNGWLVFDPLKEYVRMGIATSAVWKIEADFNKGPVHS